MNCTDFDNIYKNIVSQVSYSSNSFWLIVVSTLSITSFLLVISGEKLMKPSVALISLLLGSLLGYIAVSEIGEVKCDIKLAISGIFGLVLCILVVCILNIALFVIGAVAFGGFFHHLFYVIPDNLWPTVFSENNTQTLYWIIISSAGLLGAFLSFITKKRFLRVATSMIGGSGISLCISLVFEKLTNPPVVIQSEILLSISLFCTFLGIYVQNYNARKVKKRVNEKKRKDIEKVVKQFNNSNTNSDKILKNLKNSKKSKTKIKNKDNRFESYKGYDEP